MNIFDLLGIIELIRSFTSRLSLLKTRFGNVINNKLLSPILIMSNRKLKELFSAEKLFSFTINNMEYVQRSYGILIFIIYYIVFVPLTFFNKIIDIDSVIKTSLIILMVLFLGAISFESKEKLVKCVKQTLRRALITIIFCFAIYSTLDSISLSRDWLLVIKRIFVCVFIILLFLIFLELILKGIGTLIGCYFIPFALLAIRNLSRYFNKKNPIVGFFQFCAVISTIILVIDNLRRSLLDF